MSNPTKLRICPDDMISQCGDLVASNIDGEVALISITNGRFYCLNKTSSRIWQSIAMPTHARDVCQVLQQQFNDVEPQQLESAVLGHLAEMAEENLVQVNQSAAA